MPRYGIKPLADYKNMTAEELLKKYRAVEYSKRDVKKLNEAIETIDIANGIINRITRKYERKRNEGNGTGKAKTK